MPKKTLIKAIQAFNGLLCVLPERENSSFVEHITSRHSRYTEMAGFLSTFFLYIYKIKLIYFDILDIFESLVKQHNLFTILKTKVD